MNKTITYRNEDAEDDEEYEISVDLPAKYELCDRCEGSGVHDSSAFSNGVPSEMFDEPDFAEEYFSGHYDVVCSECEGLRVVLVIDEDRLNEEQKKHLELYHEYRHEENSLDLMYLEEKRMGC